jgi:hypothetical protein
MLTKPAQITSIALDALETLRLFMYYSVENTPNDTFKLVTNFC